MTKVCLFSKKCKPDFNCFRISEKYNSNFENSLFILHLKKFPLFSKRFQKHRGYNVLVFSNIGNVLSKHS